VAHACGEYFAFLDADDLYEPSKLERQLAAFERYPEMVMYHAAVKVIGDLDQAAIYEGAFRVALRCLIGFVGRRIILLATGFAFPVH